MIPVPDKCLMCGAEWSGGHETPGNEMKNGLRVFYDCGCSLSCERLSEGYRILIKNCENDDCTCDGEVGNNDIYCPVHCQPCYS